MNNKIQAFDTMKKSGFTHFTARFQGTEDLDNLQDYCESGEYEFDFFMSEVIRKIRQIAACDQGLVITFGREYRPVMYIQYISGYNGFFVDPETIYNRIMRHVWASEMSIDTISNTKMLRLWWDK